jgi:hypothetical protein
MSKATVTRLFVGAIVAIAAGVVLVLAAVWAAFAGGMIVVGGPDVLAVNGGSATWTVLGLVIVGTLAIIGGAIAALLSWIGALLNTVRLEDKTWFAFLLVLGLLSFGVVAMIAYVLAGPDSMRQGPKRTGIATATRI